LISTDSRPILRAFRKGRKSRGDQANNTVNCYGGTNYSAGDPSCLAATAFLHPIEAQRPRTMQFGLKYGF
jgi:hypothetical protein